MTKPMSAASTASTVPEPPAPQAKGRAWQVVVLLGWVALSFSAGVFGSQFPPGDWYAGLTKPTWNPPNWIFGPVWTALYLLMGVAAWLVWRRGGWARQRTPLMLFMAQLILNAGWSWIFFGLHRTGWALVEIVVLAVAILLTLRHFAKVSQAAAGLLVPYFVWVGFASALNFALWRLNS